ncbi:MAG: hypothetical protein ACTHNU_13655 [Gaiellales bacterium]
MSLYPAPLRELAHRSSDDLDVSLMWDPADGSCVVAVADFRTGDAFEVPVGERSPMHVFHHPYASAEHSAAA